MALHRPVTLALRLGPMRIDESLRIPAPCGMRTVPRGIAVSVSRTGFLDSTLYLPVAVTASAAGREPEASWPGWWVAGGSGCFAPTVGMAPARSTSIAPISCDNSACEPKCGSTRVRYGACRGAEAELRDGQLRCARTTRARARL